jgi:peptidoglycan/LPS O-acetylase OafA/YrhL
MNSVAALHTVQAPRAPRAAYFPLVDVLRGFAALSVVMLHVIYHTNWVAFPTVGALAWFRSGDFGVDLFFVISGFAILHSSMPLLEKYRYPGYLSYFAMRRLARLYPLYLLTSVVALALVNRDLLAAANWPGHVISHLFLLHTFDIYWFSSINGVNWTVAIEAQFYLLAAILLPLFAGRRAWAALAAFVAVALMWRYLSLQVVTGRDDPLYIFRLFVFSVQLPGRLDLFAAGMAIALLLRRPGFVRVASSRLGLGFCAVATMTLGYVFVFPGLPVWPSHDVAFVAQKLLLAVSFGMLLLLACLIRAPWLMRAVAPLRYLGVISYGLYLWHLPVLLLLKNSGYSPLSICLLTLCVTATLAATSWHGLEKPFMNRVRRWEGRRAAIPMPA